MVNIGFTHEIKDWILIFKFNWEFSNENTEILFSKIRKIIKKEKIYKLIFDMEKVEFINSRWAWWIAGIFDELDIFWGKIYITNMNENIEDTLDLLGLFLFIWKAKTNKEALDLIIKK